MKTLIPFFVFMMIMLVACNKDRFIQDEQLVLKKANVPVPLKADFCMTPNMNLPPVLIEGLPANLSTSYLPGGGWLSGNSTHTGVVQMTESAMTSVSAHFDFQNMKIVWGITGKVTAANSDYYYYDATLNINPQDKSFTGEVNMRDGVGKFDGATGTVEMVGQGMCWHAEGTMIFSR